jgi:hypothetical protein
LRLRHVLLVAALACCGGPAAFAWNDMGHMVMAWIAHERLSPAAKAQVERLLLPQPGRRPLIYLCTGPYTPTCERTYDPVTIAVWMDDFRGDSLNDDYDAWHYINMTPFFDGIPERADAGPLPTNIHERLLWAINTLRKGTGSDRRDAEALGFLYHLTGDAHQPMHAITRFSAAHPKGDAGGNFFQVKMPKAISIRNLHAYWDGAAGLFGWQNPRRPLTEAGLARIRRAAEELVKKHPEKELPESKDKNPGTWLNESNAIARSFAYREVREGARPSGSYASKAQEIAGRRIVLAGYRLAAILNDILAR